jgi:ketosteroid isomerase-like protein
MPSPNLDLVRSICEAWVRGDWSSVEWAHPEIEYVVVDLPSPGTWTGVAGIAEYWRDFLSAWEDYRIEAEEYRELDDGRVLVLAHARGRGKASGLEASVFTTTKGGATLFHLRDGRVTRLVNYWDRERAFADLGLAPEGNSA